jgi:hypothetical protein
MTNSPAQEFLAHGRALSSEGRYTDAIEMFLSSINAEPDLLEAHQALWETALLRKAEGGPSLGFFDAMKLRRGSGSDKQRLLNHEKLFAYDPSNTSDMADILHLAHRLNLAKTTRWFAELIGKANADSPKPELRL